jgi:Ni/Co efflux regulator RcnB
MKKFSAAVCVLAVAATLSSSLSFADDRGRQDDYQRGYGHAQRHDERRDYRHDDRRDDRHFDQRDGRWNDRRPDYNARGPEFHRGGYVPREYRDHRYVVNYRTYNLYRPPAGHEWVQVGADYVLIAIASGLIANIILNH